jgi:cytoskeletal protein CcmA (bactofilin family)
MLEITDGNILVSNTGTAGQLRLQEPAGSGSNYTGFKAQAQSANIVYTLPAADGTSGQVLATNGSGTLSWSSVASGSYINNGTSAQSGANFNISGAGTIGGALTAGSASISGAATIGGSATISGAATITGNAEVGSLNVDGAFSAPIVTTSSNVTLGSSDYTVILTGSTPQVTLPSASTTTGRMYVIVNQTSGSRTISSYKNFSNSNTTTVPANSAIVVQSNGTSWYQIR